MELSHVDAQGRAHMVDVSDKDVTARRAEAEGRITMSKEALEAIRNNSATKGDVLAAARLAGIMASKKTSDLIPLCHPLPVTKAAVEFSLDPDKGRITATAVVKTKDRTGVEMEALTAVSVALLTIYDMVKAVDRSMRIDGVRLLAKSGGRSGVYEATAGVD